MNQNGTTPRKPRASDFKTTADFWRYHDEHPEAFRHLDATAIVAISKQISDRNADRDKNAPDRDKTASKNGNKWELNGNSGADPLSACGEGAGGGASVQDQPLTGYQHPPKEGQFQPGHPGGPGRPLGRSSMRKIIRRHLFEDRGQGTIANAIAAALFEQALKGNTHAIRLVIESGNNRPKRTLGPRNTSTDQEPSE